VALLDVLRTRTDVTTLHLACHAPASVHFMVQAENGDAHVVDHNTQWHEDFMNEVLELNIEFSFVGLSGPFRGLCQIKQWNKWASRFLTEGFLES